MCIIISKFLKILLRNILPYQGCSTNRDLFNFSQNQFDQLSNFSLYLPNCSIKLSHLIFLFRDIDPAFLRRFEQKLLIGLPDSDERTQLIHLFLPLTRQWSKESQTKLANLTKGLTGDEIRIACKEATMQKIRQVISKKDFHSGTNPQLHLQEIVDSDLEKIFEVMKPTSHLILEKHVQWSRQYNK